jgi:hypothetical protein
MKKLKLVSLVIATTLLVSCGTTYTSTSDNAAYNVNVPSNIKGNFAVQYPDATNIVWNSYDVATVPIDWEMTGWTQLDNNDYVVTFNVGSDQYYGWYDNSGTLVGTAYAITDYSKLPYAVNTMLQNSYKDYSIEGAQRESWGTQTAYEIKLKNGDMKTKLLVDAQGNVIKEKK